MSEFKKYDSEKAKFGLFPAEVALPPIEGRGPLVHAYRSLAHSDMRGALRHLVEVIGDADVARGYVELVMAHGAQKYGQNNWRLCQEPERYRLAAMRHVLAMTYGEQLDRESALPHAAHAACCVVFFLALQESAP